MFERVCECCYYMCSFSSYFVMSIGCLFGIWVTNWLMNNWNGIQCSWKYVAFISALLWMRFFFRIWLTTFTSTTHKYDSFNGFWSFLAIYGWKMTVLSVRRWEPFVPNQLSTKTTVNWRVFVMATRVEPYSHKFAYRHAVLAFTGNFVICDQHDFTWKWSLPIHCRERDWMTAECKQKDRMGGKTIEYFFYEVESRAFSFDSYPISALVK